LAAVVVLVFLGQIRGDLVLTLYSLQLHLLAEVAAELTTALVELQAVQAVEVQLLTEVADFLLEVELQIKVAMVVLVAML
jgi:hypothetical protein